MLGEPVCILTQDILWCSTSSRPGQVQLEAEGVNGQLQASDSFSHMDNSRDILGISQQSRQNWTPVLTVAMSITPSQLAFPSFILSSCSLTSTSWDHLLVTTGTKVYISGSAFREPELSCPWDLVLDNEPAHSLQYGSAWKDVAG